MHEEKKSRVNDVSPAADLGISEAVPSKKNPEVQHRKFQNKR